MQLQAVASSESRSATLISLFFSKGSLFALPFFNSPSSPFPTARFRSALRSSSVLSLLDRVISSRILPSLSLFLPRLLPFETFALRLLSRPRIFDARIRLHSALASPPITRAFTIRERRKTRKTFYDYVYLRECENTRARAPVVLAWKNSQSTV